MISSRTITVTSYVDEGRKIPVPVVLITKENWGQYGKRSRLFRPGKESLKRVCDLANKSDRKVIATDWGWKIEEKNDIQDNEHEPIQSHGFTLDDLMSGRIPGYGT